MAEQIESSKITEFKECFNLYDRDRDGLISQDQALLVMRSLGQAVSQRELNQMMSKLGKTKVTFPEFLEFMWQTLQKPKHPKDDIYSGFKIYDDKKSGVISMKDLRHVLTRTGEKLKPHEFDYMIKELGIPRNANSVKYSDIAHGFGHV